MPTSRIRRLALAALTYGGIIVITLAIVDVLLIVLGILPPTPEYGDPDLGWRAAAPTGEMRIDRCIEFSADTIIGYVRNEDGVRTEHPAATLSADTTHVKVAVTGDSHTDLCAPNSETHAGFTERRLADRGVPARVFAHGAGRYSPLQGYLAYRHLLAPYGPEVLILNLYTGNDFYDLLRVDDRPHFVPTDSGYRIADPIWYLYADPAAPRRSRVLFLARTVADKLRIRGVLIRLRQLRSLAAEQGAGLGTVVAYMNDLRRAAHPAVGYPEAFSAQMLNQQLFFHHFPGGKAEAVRRVRALMARARRENPDLLLVMSPIPSYELVGRTPVDSTLRQTLERLPISLAGGQREEGALYDTLRVLAAEEGWVFVDNLAALRAYEGPERLYNDFDYHIRPVASALIGAGQAAAIAGARGAGDGGER